jgi:hypothetical protein
VILGSGFENSMNVNSKHLFLLYKKDLDVCGLDFSDRHVESVLKMFPKLQKLNVTGCPLSGRDEFLKKMRTKEPSK